MSTKSTQDQLWSAQLVFHQTLAAFVGKCGGLGVGFGLEAGILTLTASAKHPRVLDLQMVGDLRIRHLRQWKPGGFHEARAAVGFGPNDAVLIAKRKHAYSLAS